MLLSPRISLSSFCLLLFNIISSRKYRSESASDIKIYEKLLQYIRQAFFFLRRTTRKYLESVENQWNNECIDVQIAWILHKICTTDTKSNDVTITNSKYDIWIVKFEYFCSNWILISMIFHIKSLVLYTAIVLQKIFNIYIIPILTSGFLTSCMYFKGMEPGMGPMEVHRSAVLPNNKWFIAEELDVLIKFCPLQAAVKNKNEIYF
jgi:hypothetical protein